MLGAGNGGVTAAYHFSKLGHEVCIYDQKEFDTQIKAINKNNGIRALAEASEVKMMIPGFQAVKKATTCIEEAVEFAEILVIIVPSFAQKVIFKKMLPYLTNQHTLVFMPGNYASLVMDTVKKEMGYESLNLTYVDIISIPWACRIFEPAHIGIMGLKEFIYGGVFPRENRKKALANLNSFFPIEVRPLENVIEAGLENINFGGHPLITTINIGLLENFEGKFNYYSDCVSPATARASAKMEEERIQIGKELGLKLRSELEMMNALYNTNAKSVYEFNKTSVAHGKIHSAPNSSKSRYITEDVPYILVPCYEFAKLLSLEVPIIESAIRISSAYNDENYFETGRTLKKMGLKGMSKEEILEYVNQ
ncbi:NAD/NADP octopine/nopaline dehydrogenase family protein [Maledivibacter halophilus]|uniref:Opine dehydrogenase n=1 Tax=Maledivibacter halophilus TaxID=36842 RepID=A0A1T5M7X0_9FIRM|nr:NAD/NADP octopine/nopaline dehydrogenase family protein [Maledivibacter halophilus]SKC84331.1 opine dehydrogenase [Maledivibacter halophilus]